MPRRGLSRKLWGIGADKSTFLIARSIRNVANSQFACLCWQRIAPGDATLLVPLGLPAQNLPDLGDMSQADLPPALERRIGESLFRDMRVRERSYINDPEISDYLNRLADRPAAGPFVRLPAD